MMVRHIRLDRRQFYLFEGLGINSLIQEFSKAGKNLCRCEPGKSGQGEDGIWVAHARKLKNGLSSPRSMNNFGTSISREALVEKADFLRSYSYVFTDRKWRY